MFKAANVHSSLKQEPSHPVSKLSPKDGSAILLASWLPTGSGNPAMEPINSRWVAVPTMVVFCHLDLPRCPLTPASRTPIYRFLAKPGFLKGVKLWVASWFQKLSASPSQVSARTFPGYGQTSGLYHDLHIWSSPQPAFSWIGGASPTQTLMANNDNSWWGLEIMKNSWHLYS